MLGKIEFQAIGVALIAHRLTVVVICTPHGSTTQHSLIVQTPSTAGTVVDKEVRETGKQIVPIVVKSHNVLYFRDTLASFSIIGQPNAFRSDIKVLPVVVDAVLFQQITYCLTHPLASLRVAQVKEPVVTTSGQHPFGMFAFPKATLINTLRLEPDHK